jgi:hypothetical protein
VYDVAGELGQPQLCVRVLSTRHAGKAQVRHWLVVAVTVGQPVCDVGGSVTVLVWWSPVAAAGPMLCEVGQQTGG